MDEKVKEALAKLRAATAGLDPETRRLAIDHYVEIIGPPAPKAAPQEPSSALKCPHCQKVIVLKLQKE